jgi:pimeloyl-ACP methyl ester carboxylesterase
VRRLLRPLAAGAGITGAIAAINRGLRSGPLPTNAVGGTQRRWSWRGHEIFATEAGDGPLVLLIHDIAAGTSSYEYRKIFGGLSERCRVVAFDLLGCGLSAHPNLAYSPELFTDQIVDALTEFGDAPAVLVGSGLGGALAIRAAARANERVRQLVAICPTGLGGILDDEPHVGRGTVTTALRSPLLGESVFNVLASRAALRWHLEHDLYADRRSATDDVVDHYYAVAHQPGARFVPAYLAGGRLACNVARDLPFVTAPLLVLWGERASARSPLANAGEFVKLAQRARLVTFPQSGLLPHEEEPAAVVAAITSALDPTA